MMQSYRRIKNRIRAIENIQKITSAMEMISLSKLNRVEYRLGAMRPYVETLESVLSDLLGQMEGNPHPLFSRPVMTGTLGLCVVTSDTGLCGAYNHSILRGVESFLEAHKDQKIVCFAVGKKGEAFLKKKNIPVAFSYSGHNGRYEDAFADKIAQDAFALFLRGEIDEFYAAYTHFQTALILRPWVKKIMPLEFAPEKKRKDYILEPDAHALADSLVSKYLMFIFRMILLDAFSSEHAARTISMKAASDNAEQLLDNLTLQRNKVRQALITQDIMEIISSAELLKG